ncbi:MAG: hypothetical protein MMC33_004085 [Icmadophila ericetorum]|nr:hypothetical protein [Icmadophila ericetorum]
MASVAQPPTYLETTSTDAKPMDTEQNQMSTDLEPNTKEDTTPIQKTIRKPFPSPAESAKPAPLPELTTDQFTKYTTLLTTVSAWTEIPTISAKNSPKAPITDAERQWLTRECLLRYLRAAKWSVKDATTRLLATLTWRREYNLESFTPEYISTENETGKQFILGFDNAGRPCLYLNPGRQNSKRSEKQIHHLVFMLEQAIALMPPGQETLTLMINYAETRSGNQGPGIAQGREVLSILQSHYPERLGRALIINVPWFIWGFFKLITPFIDPLTREKLKFNENLRLHAPPEQLPTTHGGDIVFEYDHAEYWPALCGLAEQRRKEMEERWIRGGKIFGELEAYLRGGSEKGVGAGEAEAGKAPEALKEEMETAAAASGLAAVSEVSKATEEKEITEGMGKMDVNEEKMDTPTMTETSAEKMNGEKPMATKEAPAMTMEPELPKVADPVAGV